MSGVSIQPECVSVFNEIKLGHKFRYIVYALTPNLREITVLKKAVPRKSEYLSIQAVASYVFLTYIIHVSNSLDAIR